MCWLAAQPDEFKEELLCQCHLQQPTGQGLSLPHLHRGKVQIKNCNEHFTSSGASWRKALVQLLPSSHLQRGSFYSVPSGQGGSRMSHDRGVHGLCSVHAQVPGSHRQHCYTLAHRWGQAAEGGRTRGSPRTRVAAVRTAPRLQAWGAQFNPSGATCSTQTTDWTALP